MPSRDAKALQTALLATPTVLEPDAVRDVVGALNVLLADVIALYLKIKNFHWHVSGRHFRGYHLLLDEQSDQISPQWTTSPKGFGRSAARRCDRLDMSAVYSAFS